jgi:putative pyruvate formate lyase activating enzyme
MAMMIDAARREGCRNQNWVGGDPIPHIPFWLRVLMEERESTPVFFNTNGYHSPEAANLLRGVVDVYKIDFKYGSDSCAEAISDAPGYWDVVTRNLLSSKRDAELLVRILVLPGHLECCLSPMVEFIARRLGRDTRVNLMNQYAPHWRAGEVPGLNRRLGHSEWRVAVRMAMEAGLENVIT